MPKPIYAEEYKQMATSSGAPLFTFDVYHYPRKRRMTRTGVLSESEGLEIIEHIKRIISNPDAPKETK